MSAAAATPVPAPVAADSRAQRIEELGRIIMAYSELTERLQESHEQLKSQVTKLRGELSEKNRQLERKNRLAALGEMAAGLAHEIRNPLGGIQLYAGMLSQDMADRPESLSIVRKITNGVKHLESLVGQVLQFSREMQPTIRTANLADVIREAIDLGEAKARAAGVTLRAEGPESLPAQVDPNMLGQAILNLVLNGIDAQTGGGEVVVRFRAAAAGEPVRQAWVEVLDRGDGIPADTIEKIFNPFFTTKAEGTGLGLAIVHRIIEAHDGSISASNRADGGARFEVRI